MPAEPPGHKELAIQLREWIKRDGPIPFRDWMQAALYDPQLGYYRRRDRTRWGRAGDYRTLPERTPLFGATLARYFFKLFQELDSLESWTIVESGAGEGQFAAVVLQTLEQQFAAAFAGLRYVVDEASEASRSVARQRLARFGDRVAFHPLAELPSGITAIVFSNELFDAFPVHRVTLEHGSLRELYVTLNDNGEFAWTTGSLTIPQLTEYFDFVGVQLAHEGQIAEVNLDLSQWLTEACNHISRGYLITIDYGDEAANLLAPGAPGVPTGWPRNTGTLRAYRRHQFQDILKHPGESDLTTTVDWTYVKKLGEELGMETVVFERLDRFLLSAGLLEQLEFMSSQAEAESDKASLSTGARELLLPTGMAASFQILVQSLGLN
jgi:SAM-dependent MidA family methyltransferase